MARSSNIKVPTRGSKLRPGTMMRRALTCFLVPLLFSMGYGSSNEINAKLVNDRPIIGVLTQELSSSLEGVYGENYTSYIAASYVKFLEGAGARVVPIMVLIPGGANWYNESGYGQAGEILLDIAIQFNEAGDRFPVWGTCLGFELLIYLYSNKIDPRERCDAWDRADPLDFETGALQSRMFSPAPDSVLNILAYQQVTSNFHRWCVTKEGLTNAGLDSSLQVLATSVDTNGLRYISAFESRTMPIYGVQFHPEKPLYEWNTKEESIPHSAAAIYVSNYFAEFFINEGKSFITNDSKCVI
ncbi:hypothetical protein B566_EDAN016023 [Ephemera danica]|nr:hypothetical protein B566_EDAN016023 [Ephemera danica]